MSARTMIARVLSIRVWRSSPVALLIVCCGVSVSYSHLRSCSLRDDMKGGCERRCGKDREPLRRAVIKVIELMVMRVRWV